MTDGVNAPQVWMVDPASVAALKRRTLVLLGVIVPAVLVTIMLVVAETRSPRVADLAARAIPPTLTSPEGIWTSSSMQFSEIEMTILETRDYVYRTYTDGKGTPVDLCVIFSEDNRKGTHPPDVCLEGSGYRILARTPRKITVAGTPLTVREIVTRSNRGGADRYMYFAYFYKCGDTFTPSFYQQQVQIVWNGLLHRNAGGALIRYSTPLASPSDLDSARHRTDQLIALTFPYIRDGLNAPR